MTRWTPCSQSLLFRRTASWLPLQVSSAPGSAIPQAPQLFARLLCHYAPVGNLWPKHLDFGHMSLLPAGREVVEPGDVLNLKMPLPSSHEDLRKLFGDPRTLETTFSPQRLSTASAARGDAAPHADVRQGLLCLAAPESRGTINAASRLCLDCY